MNLDDQNERRIRLRAKMTDLLFQLNRDATAQKEPSDLPEQTQTYGVLVIFISSAFVIWYAGKPDSQMTALFGIHGVVLGGIVILASQFSLATKLNRFANWLHHLVRRFTDLWRSKHF